MSEPYVSRPPRLLGILVNSTGAVALTLGGIYGLWQASLAEVGPVFLIYLLPVLLALGLVPFLVYFSISLSRATYTMERDGFRLLWGLRGEDIPMNKVLWVSLSDQPGHPLLRPRLRWPGCVLGRRRQPDRTTVEFLAALSNRLVLISTPGRVFAISPQDPLAFMQTYQRLSELGSLTSIPPRSYYPNFLLARLWADLLARSLVLGGVALSLVLVIWVSLAIPGREEISLRLAPGGIPLDPQPSIRLLLLPVLNGFLIMIDLLSGLYFYRKAESQLLAFLLWGNGVLTSLLFLAAVAFILQAG